VTCFVQLQNADVDVLHKLFHKQTADTLILGIYVNKRECCAHEKLEFCEKLLKQLPEWITMTKTDAELPACVVHGDWKSRVSELDITVIIFSAGDLDASCLLENQDPKTNIGQLHDSWQKGVKFLTENTSMDCVENCVVTQPTWIGCCYDVIFGYLVRCCLWITSLWMEICDNR
jgi:hypothetical protein